MVIILEFTVCIKALDLKKIVIKNQITGGHLQSVLDILFLQLRDSPSSSTERPHEIQNIEEDFKDKLKATPQNKIHEVCRINIDM